MDLREDQLAIVARALTAIMSGKRSILIIGPTAWGKTPTLCAIANQVNLPDGSDTRILWCAHRDRLLMQGADTMHLMYPELLRRCVFLNTASPRMIRARLLILDEAHRAAAWTYHRLRQRAQEDVIVAATATSARHDRLGLDFDEVLVAPSYDDLITQGILAAYEHFALEAPTVAEHLVTAFLTSPVRWGRSIIFVQSKEEAHRSVARIRAAGIAVAPALGDQFKEAATAAFVAGSVQVLVTCHALTEGVDLPSVQTVFIRDSQRAPVMQAVGRALRRHGDKVANVVQFSRAKVPYFSVAKPHRRWIGTPTSAWTELPSEPAWHLEAAETKTRITAQSRTPTQRNP